MNYQNRNHRGQGRQDHRPAAPQVQLDHFFDDEGNLNRDWVGLKAKQFAEEINTRDLKPTGLRNFYNEFMRIKTCLQAMQKKRKSLSDF